MLNSSLYKKVVLFIFVLFGLIGCKANTEPDYVVKPDVELVNTLHNKLIQKNGTLQDLLQIDPVHDLPSNLPSGFTVVDVENVPFAYSKSHVSSSDVISRSDQIHPTYRDNYDRYIVFVPENKKPFYMIIQNGVEEKRAVRAKEIVEFFLRDVEGAEYGFNKKEVANKMGENKAILLLLTGIDGDGNNLFERYLPGQELYEIQTPIIGEDRYFTGEEKYRDAAYEEIFHLVHDFGIGANSDGALEQYQDEIAALTQSHMASNVIKRSAIKRHELKEEEAGESGISNEYIATVIDAYYGLWDAVVGWEDTWGGYEPRNRQQVISDDPKGLLLVEKFLPSYLTQVFSIDPEFSGTLKMNFTESERYTSRSQYLMWVRITGNKDVSIEGNALDNIFYAGTGNNELNGADGIDLVVYNEPYEAFTLKMTNEGGVKVEGHGSDTLLDIEFIAFEDIILAIDR